MEEGVALIPAAESGSGVAEAVRGSGHATTKLGDADGFAAAGWVWLNVATPTRNHVGGVDPSHAHCHLQFWTRILVSSPHLPLPLPHHAQVGGTVPPPLFVDVNCFPRAPWTQPFRPSCGEASWAEAQALYKPEPPFEILQRNAERTVNWATPSLAEGDAVRMNFRRSAGWMSRTDPLQSFVRGVRACAWKFLAVNDTPNPNPLCPPVEGAGLERATPCVLSGGALD